VGRFVGVSHGVELLGVLVDGVVQLLDGGLGGAQAQTVA